MLYPLVGALTAACFVSLSILTTGGAPDLISAISAMLIGVGAGLVIARFGRLGPYGGRLGSPWFENHLRATLLRETARSARFHRELTVMAVRQAKGGGLNWRCLARQTDEAMRCRGGWMLLLLPETTEEDALTLLRRASHGCDDAVQAIILSPRVFGWNGEALSRELCALMQHEWRHGEVMLNRSGQQEIVPLALS